MSLRIALVAIVADQQDVLTVKQRDAFEILALLWQLGDDLGRATAAVGARARVDEADQRLYQARLALNETEPEVVPTRRLILGHGSQRHLGQKSLFRNARCSEALLPNEE